MERVPLPVSKIVSVSSLDFLTSLLSPLEKRITFLWSTGTVVSYFCKLRWIFFNVPKS